MASQLRIARLVSVWEKSLDRCDKDTIRRRHRKILNLLEKPDLDRYSFELGPFGINCNAIAPGVTLTERVAPMWEAKTDAGRDEVLANIPLGKMPQAEDQARVIAFLASSDANFINGTTIDVAGGQR